MNEGGICRFSMRPWPLSAANCFAASENGLPHSEPLPAALGRCSRCMRHFFLAGRGLLLWEAMTKRVRSGSESDGGQRVSEEGADYQLVGLVLILALFENECYYLVVWGNPWESVRDGVGEGAVQPYDRAGAAAEEEDDEEDLQNVVFLLDNVAVNQLSWVPESDMSCALGLVASFKKEGGPTLLLRDRSDLASVPQWTRRKWSSVPGYEVLKLEERLRLVKPPTVMAPSVQEEVWRRCDAKGKEEADEQEEVHVAEDRLSGGAVDEPNFEEQHDAGGAAEFGLDVFDAALGGAGDVSALEWVGQSATTLQENGKAMVVHVRQQLGRTLDVEGFCELLAQSSNVIGALALGRDPKTCPVFHCALDRFALPFEPGGTLDLVITCRACYAAPSSSGVFGVPLSPSLQDALRAGENLWAIITTLLKSVSRHSKTHDANVQKWMSVHSAAIPAAGVAWRPQRSAVVLGADEMSLLLLLERQPQKGLAFFLDGIVTPCLSEAGPVGSLFEQLMGLVNVRTVSSETAARESAPFVARILVAMAVLPAAEQLREYVIVRPARAGSQKPLVYLYCKEPERLVVLLRELLQNTILPVLASARAPNLQLFATAKRSALPLSRYSQRGRVKNWMAGLGVPLRDGNEEEESQPMLGLPARVGQDMKIAESTVRSYLRALEALVNEGIRVEAGSEMPQLLRLFFQDQATSLSSFVGGAMKSAQAMRAALLDKHLVEIVEFFVSIKSQIVVAMSWTEELQHAIAVAVIAKRNAFGPDADTAQVQDSIVREVLAAVLLEPHLLKAVHYAVVLVMFFQLIGQRPGWLAQLASTLTLGDGALSHAFKLYGYTLWDIYGRLTLVSSNDKTVKYRGAAPLPIADFFTPPFFLAEMSVMALGAVGKEIGQTVCIAPLAGQGHSCLQAPLLLQSLERTKGRSYMIAARTRSGAALFSVFEQSMAFDYEKFVPQGGITAWVSRRIELLAKSTAVAGAKPDVQLAACFSAAQGAKASCFPAIVSGANMYRVCAATVACAVANQAPDLVAAIAQVQQHSVRVQNDVYTPSAEAVRTAAAGRSVAFLFGCDSNSFAGDDRRSDLLLGLSKMRAMLPAGRLEVSASRRGAGVALGLAWRVRAESRATVQSYRASVSDTLFSVLEAGEPGAGVELTMTAALPCPERVGAWLTVLEQFAHELVCTTCLQKLLFVARPVLDDKVWRSHGLAIPSSWLHPVDELPPLQSVAGVLVCKRCFLNRPSIEAVVTRVSTHIPRGVSREEGMKLWPDVRVKYHPPSFLDMTKAK